MFAARPAAGPTIYDVTAGQAGGAAIITCFQSGTDHIALFGYSQAAEVSQTVTSGNMVISLRDGTSITLVGVDSLAPHTINFGG